MIVFVGGLGLGAVMPAMAALNAQVLASAQASAQLSASANVSAQLMPPDVAIAGALDFIASGRALAALQLSAGGLADSLSASFSVNASASASFDVQIAAALALNVALQTPGIYVYAYDGPANALGSDVSSALASGLPVAQGGDQPIKALLLMTNAPAAWAALQQFLKTAP